jgi:RNA polymerase sigma factor (sigma-70 family)
VTHQLREELSGRFSPPLLSFFRRRVESRPQAEDLTQEVLLRVVRALEAGQIENLDRYVFKVATNLLRDRRRRALRTGTVIFVPIEASSDGLLESQLVEALCPERILTSQDVLAEAMAALAELNDLTRNIFISFRVEKMKQRDIAARYGVAQSTVEKHVMKAALHLAARCSAR